MSEGLPQMAVVLLSGGQDSTTCLYWAKQQWRHVTALWIDYGQRHVEAERAAAQAIAQFADVTLLRASLDIADLVGASLLMGPSASGNLDAGSGGVVDLASPSGSVAPAFVPGRNAIFLSLAASAAMQHGAHHVVFGASLADAAGFPDCRPAFVEAMATALISSMPSSALPFYIHTPLLRLTKADTVRMGQAYDGLWQALALTVTCYEGMRPGCGRCSACVARASGFADAAEADPANIDVGAS